MNSEQTNILMAAMLRAAGLKIARDACDAMTPPVTIRELMANVWKVSEDSRLSEVARQFFGAGPLSDCNTKTR